MELTITNTVFIEINIIIENGHLNQMSDSNEIWNAIGDYVCGLDDYEYYLIGDKEMNDIYVEIKKQLNIYD